MMKDEEKFQLSLPKNYGALATVQIGLGQVIFINSAKLMKKIFAKGNIVERKVFDHALFGEYSFVEINGQDWNDRRKLAHHALLMILKTKMINDVVNNTIQNCMSIHINQCIKQSQLWYCKSNMEHIAFNVIYYASFGHSLNEKDQLFLEFCETSSAFTYEGTKFFLTDFLNVPKWMSSMIMKYGSKFFHLQSRLNCIVDEWINESNKIDHNNNQEFPTFLKSMKEYLQENKHKYTYEQMRSDILILFLASLDTSSNTLEYAILMLAKYPNIQQQCYNELIQYFNHTNENNDMLKQFNYEQIDQLIQFRAFVFEILRLASVSRNGLPKQVNQDLWVEDENKTKYLIPRNSILFPNMHYCNRFNNDEWGINSNELNLNHWINKHNQFEMNSNFIVFSHGKRDCVGKNLAIKIISTVLGTLILNYEFKGPYGNEYFDIKRRFGGTLSVHPAIGVQVQKRK